MEGLLLSFGLVVSLSSFGGEQESQCKQEVKLEELAMWFLPCGFNLLVLLFPCALPAPVLLAPKGALRVGAPTFSLAHGMDAPFLLRPSEGPAFGARRVKQKMFLSNL